jgi:hypothetical protein
MKTAYPELVTGYLKSEKDAEPFYQRLREIQAKRETFEAEVKRCKTAHPGRARFEIAERMGVQP